MAKQTTTLRQFQEYVWELLPPMQREMLGREVVCDVVAVVVQEWPDAELSHTKSGDAGEMIAMTDLSRSVKRHLQLVYGSDKFGSLWIVALQILLPIIIEQILKWWRRRREHQGRIRIWRRKWVNGESE